VRFRSRTAVVVALFLPGRAPAQSMIDPAHKLAWAENVGWTNWRDAGDPPAAQGVYFHATFLSGFIWAENVGWVNVGDGTPANGINYANQNGDDFGVNRDFVSGKLFGYAWGENVGWINFSGGDLANPPQPARLDKIGCRLRGYVWGENIGWINLDHVTHYVGAHPSACTAGGPGDLNCDGVVNNFDIDPFVLALTDPAGYAAKYPNCNILNGDCNLHWIVNNFDIDPFVRLLTPWEG